LFFGQLPVEIVPLRVERLAVFLDQRAGCRSVLLLLGLEGGAVFLFQVSEREEVALLRGSLRRTMLLGLAFELGTMLLDVALQLRAMLRDRTGLAGRDRFDLALRFRMRGIFFGQLALKIGPRAFERLAVLFAPAGGFGRVFLPGGGEGVGMF